MSDVQRAGGKKEEGAARFVWVLFATAILLMVSGYLNHRDRATRDSLESVEINTTQRPF
jgi:hypothetical protein